MAKYMLSYHGGQKPESPEAGAAMMAQWKSWVSALGDIMIEPQNPLGVSKTVSRDGVADNGGSNPMSGYSVIQADSMEAALEIAKSCPFIDLARGEIVVSEIIQM